MYDCKYPYLCAFHTNDPIEIPTGIKKEAN